MPYIADIPGTLDRDGELPIVVPRSMSEDVMVYVTRDDVEQMAGAFGYALIRLPRAVSQTPAT